MGNVRTKIQSLIKKNKLLPVFAALLVVILVVMSLFSDTQSKTNEPETTDTYNSQYATALETRLSGIVMGINGVDSCEVMITLDGGVEYIYASDSQHSQSSGDKESSEGKSSLTVLSDKQSGEKAVVVKEIYPEIKGVAVVCKGIDSPTVTLAITDAVSTVLGISANKVCVIIEN